MFKMIAYLIRKPGISREEFRQRYETALVPHMLKTFPIAKYTRNYIDPSVAVVVPGATLPPFDALTEIYFKTKADFDAMMSAMADPKVFGEVDAIEKTFLDTTKTCLVMAEESGHG
jgi:hypothetical protein